ncbi:hypothetical protein [uncultured Sphingomonas sp.]|uniref:hypothetical protein n=1 Tax=uncultured Sphingomonas sp. TaxID=158754 RepID=UPI0025F3C1D3|nr:hypothetical protein [uncultured Sphingomonas sp.]
MNQAIWRAIGRIESVLPAVDAPDAEADTRNRRLAALTLSIVPGAIVAVNVFKEREVLGAVLHFNAVMLQQAVLVLAGCVAVAGVGFGVKAWHSARKIA